ncbi:hypothetical protein KDW_48900 [Dictyobacter vulcani]|uniref:Uncharacterized protein n=1 Tax=Dictyobacter vulcani TaxID=2607529 RepID=A0A5J4KLY5_9CHLR|nr:hypothetical protein [Dictyobacter vulcani]GER90728.1 hypothetical protein KDW_48900 [Dictyobacter vulcani]
MMIEKGAVIRSLVMDMRGNTISHDQEYEALWQSNEWEVVLPSEIPPQLQQRTTEPLALNPRAMRSHSSEAIVILLSKKRDISDRELADLSVKQRMQLRMVLTMINGQRTSDELKATIHLPGQLIDEILFYLFCIDAIE